MNRKAENEFKQLVKLGVPEETAKLIAVWRKRITMWNTKIYIRIQENRRGIKRRKVNMLKWYIWLIIF